MSTPAEDFDRAMEMLTGMTSETAESKKPAGGGPTVTLVEILNLSD
jgi:hypothetical protein